MSESITAPTALPTEALAEPLRFSDLLPSRCFVACQTFWDPDHATFAHGCFPIVVLVPTALALVTLLAIPFQPALSRLSPSILRNFAEEEPSETKPAHDAPAPATSKCWTPPAWSVFKLTLASAALAAIASASLDSPLFLIPVAPGLVSAAIVAAKRPRTLPTAVFVLNGITFLVLAVASLAITGGPLLSAAFETIIWYLEVLFGILSLWSMARMPLRDPFLDGSETNPTFAPPTNRLRSPEDNLTLWNWLTVDWLEPLVTLGWSRQINEEDVWGLPLSWDHARCFVRLRQLRGSIVWRIIKANTRDLLLVPAINILATVLSMGEVVLMKQILGALRFEHQDTRAAVAYAVFILLFRLCEAQVGVLTAWHGRRMYERGRGQLILAIYEKGLRRKAFTFGGSHHAEEPPSSQDSSPPTSETLSVQDVPADESAPLLPQSPGDAQSASKPSWWNFLRRQGFAAPPPPAAAAPFTPASAGKLYDLIKHDAYEVAERLWGWENNFVLPLRVCLSLYLIWSFLGPSAFLGIAVVVASQLGSAGLARILIRYQKRRRGVSDDKLQITTNFIQAIRHLRWYDWQEKWLARILDARRRELLLFVVTNSISNVISFVQVSASVFFPVAAFYAYTVLAGHPLSIHIAFPALDLFNTLNDAMREIPTIITDWINTFVALGRINSFMSEPDKEDARTDFLDVEPEHPPGELRVELRDASFSWPGTPQEVLNSVTCRFIVGLTVVCGRVGAGKSALLHAILGEMDLKSGDADISDEPKGYCNQTPWLESLSIRDNILFSSPMNLTRYRHVLDACCLLPDLATFTGGDLCHIGENGVGLSGGQQARVALARSIYSSSRILLLDDPIAALDHNTAETILTRLCRSTLLNDRIVIFVTHRTDLVLPYADQVLEVHHGKVRPATPDNMEELREIGRDQDEYEYKPDEARDVVPERFIKEEHRAQGAVVAAVYWRYIKYGSFWLWAGLISAMTVFRVARILYFYFLKVWGEAYSEDAVMAIGASRAILHSPIFGVLMTESDEWWARLRDHLGLPNPADNVLPWLGWFSMIAAFKMVVWGSCNLLIVALLYVSGKRIFNDVMRAITGATFRFYDVTPVGRLLNRLTSDLRAIDGAVLNEMHALAWYAVGWLSSLAVIGSITPAFLAIAIITSLGFVHLFRRFFPVAQSLRRLEMTRLSPLLTDFGILVDGLVTVRAFHAEPHFQARTMRTTDKFQNMDHFYWTCEAWLQYRFDIVSAVSTFLLSAFAIVSGLSEGTVAFVLTAAGGFVSSTHHLCKSYGQLQMHFVSVERIVELLDIDQEPQGTMEPPASWPSSNDDIVLDNVTVRYAPHLDPVIRNMSVRIPAGSSVAITGRTGSGKSTLALALLGTVLPDLDVGGDIYIGNVPITLVDKHALRSRVSFVAQDPVLFTGPLRDNLDPQKEHSDEECAAILERVLSEPQRPTRPADMDDYLAVPSRERFILASRVDAGGLNLSQGQRQLIGLGRAILRRSAVVILDEATASIDAHTAAEIQGIMRTELKGSTVITIAHRAEAVAGAEYVLELANGRVKLFRKMAGGESALR